MGRVKSEFESSVHSSFVYAWLRLNICQDFVTDRKPIIYSRLVLTTLNETLEVKKRKYVVNNAIDKILL